MDISKLTQAFDDITSLEVATVTSNDAISIQPQITGDNKTALDQLQQDVDTAKQELSTAVTAGTTGDALTAAQTKVQNAKDALADKQKTLGVFDPKDTFTNIQAVIGTNTNVQLVAYSKFELGGDSLSYVTNNQELQSLVASHSKLVESSQASRAALVDTIKKFL